MVVVIRPGAAVIAGAGVVQSTDSVSRITARAGHCSTRDDYVLAAVPLEDPQRSKIAALGEVHSDEDVSGSLRSEKAAGLVCAWRLLHPGCCRQARIRHRRGPPKREWASRFPSTPAAPKRPELPRRCRRPVALPATLMSLSVLGESPPASDACKPP